jgi:hypothetical protein
MTLAVDRESKLESAAAAARGIVSCWMTMTPETLDSLIDRSAVHWRAAIRRWEHRPEVLLFDEVTQILTQAACGWVGIPLPRDEVRKRARQLARLTLAPGGRGPRRWGGAFARFEVERWIERIVGEARRGRIRVPRGSALYLLTREGGEGDGNSSAVDTKAAARELLDVLRATVSVAWPIVFPARELDEAPSSCERIACDAITSREVELADHFLTRCVTYDVVSDPTRPQGGFVLTNVRATAGLDAAPFRLAKVAKESPHAG